MTNIRTIEISFIAVKMAKVSVYDLKLQGLTHWLFILMQLVTSKQNAEYMRRDIKNAN